MRIAHVTATFPPLLNGTANVSYYNARELVRLGHTVHVFTASTGRLPRNEVVEGIHVHYLRPLLRIGNAPILPGLLAALRSFDVIHLHYPFISGAELARFASLLYHTPLVLTFHNDLIGDGKRAVIFSIYQRLSSVLSVRAASRLCVVSYDHFQASQLSSLLKGRGSVVELANGVDIQDFQPSGPKVDLQGKYGLPPGAKVMLFVAALDRAHHFKGLDRLFAAFQYLPPNIYLLIVGDGDQRAGYEREARRLGISERAIFAGSIDHKETPPFFRRADVVVLPSSPPESFGLVLIEALACGTPVVASNIAGVRTVVDHGSDGLLVNSENPVSLAESILDILEDDGKRLAMGQHGREKVVRRYAWGQIGNRLDTLYRQLIEERNIQARPMGKDIS